MKLVKSLLLGSVAGVAAVASAQAADLPFRKAAPVEYVRVCDFTGAGFFYIPGTDTCLKIEGFVRAEYAAIEQQNSFSPSNFGGPNAGLINGRNQDLSGFFARGRLAADARTQTAYGTLRTYVRYEITEAFGNYGGALSQGGETNTNQNSAAHLDKGYITFAGLQAGRFQSIFDFYADNYNFEGIANSDQSSDGINYTYTFGGGFSAIIGVEDRNVRVDGIGNINAGAAGTAGYAGEVIPDVVGAIRLDQAWGSAQISAAYHDVNTSTGAFGGPSAVTEGFAVQAGVQIKLPMLAAGDDLWLEGAYQEGAYLYQDSAGSFNSGFNNHFVGGLLHEDHDAVAVFNPVTGGYTLSKGSGFSVMAAFHHYFTPQFHNVLFGSYEEIGYGAAVRNTSFLTGGIGDASEYRIGDQIIFTPVHNLSLGLEFVYAHIDQDIAGNANDQAFFNTVVRPLGISQNPDAFEGRLRIERDF